MDQQTERMYELMKKETNRLKTFQMEPAWPIDFIDIKDLARAGFFYAFKEDHVHCAFCRGQVCRWQRGDDPMIEHARHFDTCPFIMRGDVGNEPLGEDPFPGPKRPIPYDVCGIYDNTQGEDSGVSGNESNDEHDPDLDHQFQTPDNILRIENPISTNRFINDLYSHNQNSTDIIHSNLSNNHNQQYSLSTPNQNNPIDSNLSGICKICYVNPIQICIIPCGHSACCVGCSQRVDRCPCCRLPIMHRIRTYIV